MTFDIVLTSIVIHEVRGVEITTHPHKVEVARLPPADSDFQPPASM
mgnify:CR=1 FL=1